MTGDTRQKLADALHTHAFAISKDARAAAQITDLMLAQIDRELTYCSLVESHREALTLLRSVTESGRPDNVHVLGNRGGDAA